MQFLALLSSCTDFLKFLNGLRFQTLSLIQNILSHEFQPDFLLAFFRFNSDFFYIRERIAVAMFYLTVVHFIICDFSFQRFLCSFQQLIFIVSLGLFHVVKMNPVLIYQPKILHVVFVLRKVIKIRAQGACKDACILITFFQYQYFCRENYVISDYLQQIVLYRNYQLSYYNISCYNSNSKLSFWGKRLLKLLVSFYLVDL